jgi:hypothetical protein
MPKLRVEKELEDGWSRWVHPVMDDYRLACCDCGLVHTMDFQVVLVTKKHKDGSWSYKPLSKSKYRVMFRARRNNRSTAAHRRKKK